MQFRVILVTDTARPPATNTQTGPITIHCVPKFQLEMVTACTYRLSLVKIDARNFKLHVVTDTARPPATNTQTGLITIHCAAQCN